MKTDLSKILSVSGQSGLFQYVAQARSGAIVEALADSSVNLTVRAWVDTVNYWEVFFLMNERFYKELPKVGINFPFPQMDVHMKKD